MLARSRDKAFLPTVQEHMFVDIYMKVSAYAIGIMSKHLRLAKTVRLLPLERDVQDCTDFCMSNFDLPCQQWFSPHFKYRMDYMLCWILPKSMPIGFSTKLLCMWVTCRMQESKNLSQNKKNHSTRILTAKEGSNKRQTRCSVCREYGHNKSRYAKRIIVANNHARQQASQVGGIGIITYFSN